MVKNHLYNKIYFYDLLKETKDLRGNLVWFLSTFYLKRHMERG